MTNGSATERLDYHARHWNVALEETQRSVYSLIGFGAREGRPVVLKVVKQQGEEWRSGELLAAFGGNGLVRAIKYTEGAVLLERLHPGNNLAAAAMAGRDAEATEILAGIIEQMASVRPAWPRALQVETLATGFQKYAHSCDGLMPRGMVENAESLFYTLCASQRDLRLLHGDLHHYNVFFLAPLGDQCCSTPIAAG